MINLFYKVLIIALTGLLLAGCLPGEAGRSVSPTRTILPDVFLSPTIPYTAKVTLENPTPSPPDPAPNTPASTSTSTLPTAVRASSPDFVKNCSSLALGSLEGWFLSSGTLVFVQYPLSNHQISTIAAGSVTVDEIDFGGSVFVTVSNESGSIAWVAENRDDIIIRTGEGILFEHPGAVSEYGYPVQWVHDDQLLLRKALQPPREDGEARREYYLAADDFYLLKPGNPHPEHYQIRMDGFFTYELFSPGLRAALAYAPDMTRVIYAWRQDYGGHGQEEGLLVWDIENASVVWKQIGLVQTPEHTFSQWQRDGSHVAFSAPSAPSARVHELFKVSRDGEETRLTYLDQIFLHYYEIRFVYWSPDDRFLAFIVINDVGQPITSRSLYILDTETGTVVDHCLPYPVSQVVWSPDSRQVAFLLNDENGFGDRLGVLDLQSNTYFLLDNVSRLLGWVESVFR